MLARVMVRKRVVFFLFCLCLFTAGARRSPPLAPPPFICYKQTNKKITKIASQYLKRSKRRKKNIHAFELKNQYI